MSLITGGGISDNIFKDLAQLQLAEVPNDRRLELITGERYYTSATDTGGGLLLANGNYAILIDSGGSVIKSIQRGNLVLEPNLSEAVTINEIDPDKSTLNITCRNGYRTSGTSNYAASYEIAGSISSSTSISLAAGSAPGVVGSDARAYWEVVEYV